MSRVRAIDDQPLGRDSRAGKASNYYEANYAKIA